ncbi:lipopolysaccharide heptosyltransferase II [Pseudorhodoplanes sinuspersici]|uniref:lipopolysaccharide heptosyltransferase II n=1 Tax=Pseudorhodoplanes sinuspersici TaxID=1235591 RepID=A0A1W6ZTL5_9HYPH|nr:lipopolysaccharide heptosyltransferase II [Pseudorhodoplanes sinuspersici]ARQ00690.1 lipopolysaccharide heptosyltransferase II [Pseudorhodoplanes sinuspersici]RKE72297.1 heptosyltransferase-2 [Pseudorhodoplanes sinuspersici]
MSQNSDHKAAGADSPILIVPYMWIGDFVRVHSVVRLLKARWPDRPIDLITSSLCAPILDYLPGVRTGIVADLPRRRLPFGQYLELAQRLKAERYGTALVMPRTWKSALAPFLAGIPERIGFAGEGRFLLINDMRWGERKLERMIDCFGALALPKNAVLPKDWPLPDIDVPAAEIEAWRARNGLSGGRPVVAFAPGAVGPGKAWPPEHYAELARRLAADGCEIWVLGGPQERQIAEKLCGIGGESVRNLTGNDLRNAILALRSADVAVTNDSGLMHIAAAIGTPTVAIFGPTSPRLWAPLNPLAAIIEPPGQFANIKDRSTSGVDVGRVHDAVRAALPQKLTTGTNVS